MTVSISDAPWRMANSVSRALAADRGAPSGKPTTDATRTLDPFRAVEAVSTMDELIHTATVPSCMASAHSRSTSAHVASGLRSCLLYTSDAADDLLCVDLGGR